MGGGGGEFEPKLLKIPAHSRNLFCFRAVFMLRLGNFHGKGGDCAILLLNQGLIGLEFIPNSAELLGLHVVALLEFHYLGGEGIWVSKCTFKAHAFERMVLTFERRARTFETQRDSAHI